MGCFYLHPFDEGGGTDDVEPLLRVLGDEVGDPRRLATARKSDEHVHLALLALLDSRTKNN